MHLTMHAVSWALAHVLQCACWSHSATAAGYVVAAVLLKEFERHYGDNLASAVAAGVVSPADESEMMDVIFQNQRKPRKQLLPYLLVSRRLGLVQCDACTCVPWLTPAPSSCKL